VGIWAWQALSCDKYRGINKLENINIAKQFGVFAPSCIIILKSARCVRKRDRKYVSSFITTSVQTIFDCDIHFSSYAQYMHSNSRTHSCKMSVYCCPI
jgi:phosphoribosylanthranilate isomerase